MKFLTSATGLIIGCINSLLGAGGGLLTVPFLNKQGLEQKRSQATSMLVILPLSVISTVLYLNKGYADFKSALIFIPGGIIGAVIGGLTLNKIPQTALKFIFSGFMIYAGVRMLVG